MDMNAALTTLKTELDNRSGLITDIVGNRIEICRDWSYQVAVNTSTAWYVPGDEWVEETSEIIAVTYTDTAFVAKNERGITVALEVVEDGDIESAAYSMAETLDELLPTRDIAGEIAEAKAMDMLFRLEDAA